MLNLVDILYSTYDKQPPLVSLDSKLADKVYLNPSSSGAYTKGTDKPIGACMKKVWLDKKGYPSTVPLTAYNQLNFDFGNMIEDWVIEKCKKAGIYLDSNVKIVDNNLFLSGEIDILIKNPDTGRKEVIEVKSYNGGNFSAAKEVLGDKNTLPKPKDAYLLQVATYLIMLARYGIDTVHLLYIDKSASKLYNSKQFTVYLKGDDIVYETMHMGQVITLKEDRFGVKEILDRNATLQTLLEEDYVPPEDYMMSYPEEMVEELFKSGEIPEYKYKAYKKSPMTVELGSWVCQYCPYGKNPETGDSTCINVTNDTKGACL